MSQSNMWDGMFNAFRSKPGPALYPSIYITANEDPTFWACITLMLIVVTSYLLTILGLPSNERLKSLSRFLLGAAVTFNILACLFGREWFSATVTSRVPYTVHSDLEINATVGIKVGLKQINVTLKGNPEIVDGETINYNEKFKMENFKTLGADYKKALARGSPTPILWVAEYLAMDMGGVRYGRYYRIAGHYTYIALWAAFACWVVTCVVYNINVYRAAELTVLTGFILLVGVITHSVLAPDTLRIKFRDAWLEVGRGWCFWLTMLTGILVLLGGILLLILDRCIPAKTAAFFSLQMNVDEDRSTSTPSILKTRRSVTPLSIDSNSNIAVTRKPPSGTHEMFVVNEPSSAESRKRNDSARADSGSNRVQGTGDSQQTEQRKTPAPSTSNESRGGDLDDGQDALEKEILKMQETTNL